MSPLRAPLRTRARRRSARADTLRPVSPADPATIDLVLLARRVHRAGGDVLVERTLDRLLTRVRDVLAGHADATDGERHTAFHNLKTSLRTVGLERLGDRAEALDEGFEDRAAGAAPADDLDALVDAFAADWERARPEVEALRDAARDGTLVLPPVPGDGPGRGP